MNVGINTNMNVFDVATTSDGMINVNIMAT